MNSLKSSFEKELHQKLSLQANSILKEEALLQETFHYFDLNNSGNADQLIFLKVIEKIGITSYSKEELAQLFMEYDLKGTSLLDFQDFTARLFRKEGTTLHQTQVEKQPRKMDKLMPLCQGYCSNSREEEILDFFRTRIRIRGVNGFLEACRLFHDFDNGKDKTIKKHQFKGAVNELFIEINDADALMLFSQIDIENTGEITQDQFMKIIIGKMNQFRLKIVLDLFAKLDKKHQGTIEISEIISFYERIKNFNGSAYFRDFPKNFAEYHGIQSGQNRTDNSKKLVDSKEFVDFHENISSTIEKDKNFQEMLNVVLENL